MHRGKHRNRIYHSKRIRKIHGRFKTARTANGRPYILLPFVGAAIGRPS